MVNEANRNPNQSPALQPAYRVRLSPEPGALAGRYGQVEIIYPAPEVRLPHPPPGRERDITMAGLPAPCLYTLTRIAGPRSLPLVLARLFPRKAAR